MTTLTAQTAFVIASQSPEVTAIELEVLPVAAGGSGYGRLVHPSLGTYDYPHQPKQWTNIDGDALIKPDWQTSRTLTSGRATLWRGNIRDVQCSEIWTTTGGLSMPMNMFRMLWSFFQNPPDPETDGYVEWHPTYLTDIKYKVALTSITVGGAAVTLSDISLRGWVTGRVVVTYQLVDYVEEGGQEPPPV